MSKQYSKVDMELATEEFVNKHLGEGVTMETNTTINNETVNVVVEENKEGVVMDTAKRLTQEMSQKVKNFAGNVKVTFNEETGEIKSNLDDNLNVLKNTLVPAIGYIDGALGLTPLKNELCDIIYDYTANGKSKNSYIKMARKCREAINEQIELLDVDDSEDFKKVVALRQFIGEDEDGQLVTQSIFSAFAKGVVWLIKKAAKYIKGCPLFSNDPEVNLFGSVGAKIAGFIGEFFNVAKAIVGVTANIVKYAFSYAAAGLLKLGSIVVDFFKDVFSKGKEFIVDKFKERKVNENEIDEEIEQEIGEDFESI